MPYLVRGNGLQLAQLFDKAWLFEQADTPVGEMIEFDLAKSAFLGGQADAEHHLSTWQMAAPLRLYTQGDMTAANLFFFLNKQLLFKKDNEELEDYQRNYGVLSFAYVNAQKELCGLSIHYRKDNPAQWFIASSKNPAAPLEQRELVLFSSQDLQQLGAPAGVEQRELPWQSFIEQLDPSLARPFLEHGLFNAQGEIKDSFVRLTQLLRPINRKAKGLIDDPLPFELVNPELLFMDNPSFALLSQHKIPLSTKLLLDCLATPSGLAQELEALKLSDKPEINACILRITVYFYERGLLAKHRALVTSELMNKAYAGLIWSDEQISLAARLLEKNYAPELLQQMLSRRAYYVAVHELLNLGFSKELPKFFANPDKLIELDRIDAVESLSLKKLCLVFWLKGELNVADYEAIIKAGTRYPLLAETLIALDKTGEVSIVELKELALEPQKHLQQSIIHHFAADYPVNKITLTKLSVQELTRLNEALVVLKGKTKPSSEEFERAARDNQQAQLLRIFLPTLASIYKQDYRDTLINLVYEGIEKGPISLDKQIAVLAEPRLRALAMELRDRVHCAKQMQRLSLGDDLISFAATNNNKQAQRFRNVILKVEATCKRINTRLDAKADVKIRAAWQEAELEYRTIIYKLASQAIKDPNYNYGPALDEAQKKVLDLVEPEAKSWLEKLLIVLANVFTYALRPGSVNAANEKRVGNFWFFNHTESGNELRHLDQELNSQIRGPK